jgi:hypothetical protein
MSKATEEKRMYDSLKAHAEDMSYENEGSTVTIPLKEYDKLKEKTKYITDSDMIGYIDKIEFFVKELRKHIVRTDI